MMSHPRDNDDVLWIGDLKVSTLMLFRDQRFRGYCILSFAPRDAISLEALSDEESSGQDGYTHRGCLG